MQKGQANAQNAANDNRADAEDLGYGRAKAVSFVNS